MLMIIYIKIISIYVNAMYVCVYIRVIYIKTYLHACILDNTTHGFSNLHRRLENLSSQSIILENHLNYYACRWEKKTWSIYIINLYIFH